MNGIWLLFLSAVLVGSVSPVVLETGGSSGSGSPDGPGLIENVRDLAVDDVGSVVGEVSNFLSQVPGRFGLGSDNPFDDGEFVPPAARADEAPLGPADLALLLSGPPLAAGDSAEFPASDDGAADDGSKDGKHDVCQETGGDGDVTLSLPDGGARAHLDKGDAEGSCEPSGDD